MLQNLISLTSFYITKTPQKDLWHLTMIIGLEKRLKPTNKAEKKNSNIIVKMFSFGKVAGHQNPIHGYTNLARYCFRL